MKRANGDKKQTTTDAFQAIEKLRLLSTTRKLVGLKSLDITKTDITNLYLVGLEANVPGSVIWRLYLQDLAKVTGHFAENHKVDASLEIGKELEEIIKALSRERNA